MLSDASPQRILGIRLMRRRRGRLRVMQFASASRGSLLLRPDAVPNSRARRRAFKQQLGTDFHNGEKRLLLSDFVRARRVSRKGWGHGQELGKQQVNCLVVRRGKAVSKVADLCFSFNVFRSATRSYLCGKQ